MTTAGILAGRKINRSVPELRSTTLPVKFNPLQVLQWSSHSMDPYLPQILSMRGGCRDYRCFLGSFILENAPFAVQVRT